MAPAEAVKVGDSLRSDVLAMFAAGGWGIHVPHPLTSAPEAAEPPVGHPHFRTAAVIAGVAALVAAIAAG
jgi:putative hydrolase of the HAD superfamily